MSLQDSVSTLLQEFSLIDIRDEIDFQDKSRHEKMESDMWLCSKEEKRIYDSDGGCDTDVEEKTSLKFLCIFEGKRYKVLFDVTETLYLDYDEFPHSYKVKLMHLEVFKDATLVFSGELEAEKFETQDETHEEIKDKLCDIILFYRDHSHEKYRFS